MRCHLDLRQPCQRSAQADHREDRMPGIARHDDWHMEELYESFAVEAFAERRAANALAHKETLRNGAAGTLCPHAGQHDQHMDGSAAAIFMGALCMA
ncbi:hypothetical protein [Streptomyces sp. NPDC016172]|uniref:hypothetical protein n=1 Tax=Streptomyces sp. NPDC016172 TaxID=3364964 RepID=UPI0037007A6D